MLEKLALGRTLPVWSRVRNTLAVSLSDLVRPRDLSMIPVQYSMKLVKTFNSLRMKFRLAGNSPKSPLAT